MRLKTFTYQDHRQHHSISIRLDDRPLPLLESMTRNLAFTVLVGPNGVGKTSLLSQLVRLFHNADWYQDRIGGDALASYTLPNVEGEIHLRSDRGTFLSSLSYSQRIADSAKRGSDYEDARIEKWLPYVVASVFSTRGEYPSPKRTNYRGLKKTSIYDVGRIYGRNHYNVGSLSEGIRRLIRTEGGAARQGLARLTGLQVARRVRVFEHFDPRSLSGVEDITFPTDAPEGYWMDLPEGGAESDLFDEKYINDVELEDASGRTLSLMTLSSGQKMLMVRLLSILASIRHGSLVILEEPELHLDPQWCAGLLSLLCAFFGDYQAHIVLSTHHPSIIRCFPSSHVVAMSAEGARAPNVETFLASESVIIDELFRGGTAFSDIDDRVRNAFMDGVQGRQGIHDYIGEGPLRYLLWRSSRSEGV